MPAPQGLSLRLRLHLAQRLEVAAVVRLGRTCVCSFFSPWTLHWWLFSPLLLSSCSDLFISTVLRSASGLFSPGPSVLTWADVLKSGSLIPASSPSESPSAGGPC